MDDHGHSDDNSDYESAPSDDNGSIGDDGSDSDASNASCGSDAESAPDDDESSGCVDSIVTNDPCTTSCVDSKRDKLLQFVQATATMSKTERKASLLATLSVLTVGQEQKKRLRFGYVLPVVGECCRTVFCACYGIASASLDRFRAQAARGSIAPQVHGGRRNQNAAKIDRVWLAAWFRSFAESVGQEVPVRVRRKSTEDKTSTRVSTQRYVMLPAYFTWQRLHHELTLFAQEECDQQRELGEHALVPLQRKRSRAKDRAATQTSNEHQDTTATTTRVIPDESAMRKILTKSCPDIKIGSPRSNVCDVCFIYMSTLNKRSNVGDTERFGAHTRAAKAMR